MQSSCLHRAVRFFKYTAENQWWPRMRYALNWNAVLPVGPKLWIHLSDLNYRETEHELRRLELFKATETWRHNPQLQQSNLPAPTHSFSGSGSSQRTHINGSCKQQQELQSNRHAGGLFLRLTDDYLTVIAEWSSTPFGGVSVLIRA